VRLEEMVNYFAYDYRGRNKSHAPFTTHTALAINPWKPHSHLLRVAIKAYQEPAQALPPANLVFLIDVSGSMRARNKLALLKPALKR